MGQYYKAVNITKGQYLTSWEHNSGSKLMEHSWMPNNFVAGVTQLLSNDWHGDSIVWAGDYGDEGLFTSIHYNKMNLYNFANEFFEEITRKGVDADIQNQEYPYLLNHDKGEYVDLRNCPSGEDDWIVHPLPLLVSNGNGRGFGDYRGNSLYIGQWAGSRISVDNQIPDGYIEIQPNFKE